MTQSNSELLRNALRQFLTGVVVVTTVNSQGEPVGLAANSFSSVSLSPPLVLWSLNKKSKSLNAFQATKYFGISVLSADQMSLASRFAAPIENRFSGVEFKQSSSGVPMFENCASWFECSSSSEYDGGDHVIFVGKVISCGCSDRMPLLYARGAYGVPSPHPEVA
jgi:flavin reductase (DIM6/NTAB) family NADH-FMN oxidoreductase RutF